MMNISWETLLERAISIATEAHAHQRQRNGLPYILHPLTVMMQVEGLPAKIVAVLHDVVEDTPVTLALLGEAGFPEEVLQALALLTRSADESYTQFIGRIAPNSLARRVKLADITHNMDIRRLDQLTPKDNERLAHYHAGWLELQAWEVRELGPHAP